MRGPNAKSGSRWRGRSRSGINPARPCLWEGLPAGPVRVASNEGRDAHNVRFELHCRRRYSQSECRLWIVCCRFGHDPGAKQSDTPITVSGNDRFVLGAAAAASAVSRMSAAFISTSLRTVQGRLLTFSPDDSQPRHPSRI